MSDGNPPHTQCVSIQVKVDDIIQVLDQAILVWPFRHAPKKLRLLSHHGGDEDWVAYIPANAPDKDPFWAEDGTQFGCCSVQRCEFEDGSVVLIGAHA